MLELEEFVDEKGNSVPELKDLVGKWVGGNLVQWAEVDGVRTLTCGEHFFVTSLSEVNKELRVDRAQQLIAAYRCGVEDVEPCRGGGRG